MTMKTLANLAGVSVSTVSKAFSGSKEISEAKREHIFKTARENGCFEKYCKTNFRKPVIAVICPEFQSGYYSQHLSLLEREINKHGGLMVASCSLFDKKKVLESLSYFTECAKVSGAIVYFSGINKKFGVPIISVGQNDNFDSISISAKKSTYDAIKFFVDNGHKDIAFIGENLTSSRLNDFCNAMVENGVEINGDYIIKTEKRFEIAGYDAMNLLLSLPKPPTAVFAAYDNIALGAMKSIFEHGLKIPDDISVIGIDDNQQSSFFNVPLASITSYNEDLCEIIVNMLFERIENGNTGKPKKVQLSTELVKRNSVGAVKNRL